MDAPNQSQPDLAALLGPYLTEQQARSIIAQGEEAVLFALLTFAKLLADAKNQNASHLPTPSTPSGTIPPQLKDANKKEKDKKKKKKPKNKPKGRPKGHPGARRNTNVEINEYKDHRLEFCPDCGSELKRCTATRTRITEDIPEKIEPVVTEHTIHRDYCPNCKKIVEPIVDDALPNSTIGIRVLVVTAWLHYALGTTLNQIVDVFNFVLSFQLTGGGLTQMWHRLGEIVDPWYEQIRESALKSAVLHADETGWRVGGKTWWLWCFTTASETFYMIDKSRGSPALKQFFKEEYNGILVTDFWATYNAVVCAGFQKCLAHLLRELEHVKKYKDTTGDWEVFCKRLKKIVKDGISLWYSRKELDTVVYERRLQLLESRMDKLLSEEWTNSQAKRLTKRLLKYRTHLFTYLYEEEVPFDNNHAERQIRCGVVMRKNSNCNRSVEGAVTQSKLMSVFRTLKQRGLHPTQALISAIRTFVKTGKIDPIPSKNTSLG